MRDAPSVLHLDMDAFYASVEQLHKPSLRGRPVVVGWVGARGVVATASYEARRYGVRSAMAMSEARRRCPQAVYLVPRFEAYGAVSAVVMGMLRELSPAVEPISMDEAFVDLAAGIADGLDTPSVTALGTRLKAEIRARTGLTASIGAGTSKLIAKIASDSRKPDGLVVVPPGQERALLDPLPVRALWGIGPASAERLHKAGVTTIGELAELPLERLTALFGVARGGAFHEMARGLDPRPVVADRELKSISVEDTFPTDLTGRAELIAELDGLARRVAVRLRARERSGRTISLKVRRHDFTTVARADTLSAPTDDEVVIRDVARRLLGTVEVGAGIRLLGIGVSSLSDFAQQDLFDAPRPAGAPEQREEEPARGWYPGADVIHDQHGPGWVERVEQDALIVRFETPDSPPGPVRRLPAADPALHAAPPPAATTPRSA
ncbi:MAG TPA: DNA polymerase IV [Candidatus Dormibacteraeota bacterium]|nr:DNA polymerase IV [Candidatus Dormibacteraeota bacterium]